MGTQASHAISQIVIVSYIAANGPIAFATSFAPWAKERRHAENTRGILKSLLIDFFEFLKNPENFTSNFFTPKYTEIQTHTENIHAVVMSTDIICQSHFIIRYPVKLPAMIAIYIGTHFCAASCRDSWCIIVESIDQRKNAAMSHQSMGDIIQLAIICQIIIQLIAEKPIANIPAPTSHPSTECVADTGDFV